MNLQELKSAIDAAVSAYHAAPSYEASEAVQSARAALASAVADGAVACPGCGGMPVGIVQPVAVKHKVFNAYEIGCLSCAGRKVSAPLSRELAVQMWNDEASK